MEQAEGFRDLYSVTWPPAGFLLQFEKNECFQSSLQFHFKVEHEDFFFLKVERSDFTVSLKATVEVLKRQLR